MASLEKSVEVEYKENPLLQTPTPGKDITKSLFLLYGTPSYLSKLCNYFSKILNKYFY